MVPRLYFFMLNPSEHELSTTYDTKMLKDSSYFKTLKCCINPAYVKFNIYLQDEFQTQLSSA